MSDLFVVVLLSSGLVIATVLTHYSALWVVTDAFARGSVRQASARRRRQVIVAVIGILFCVHLLEVLYYAAALRYMHGQGRFGSLTGLADDSFGAFAYFSIVTYTSVGYGDITPTGFLRVLAGFEALNGILMIAWTGSFTFLLMQRVWSLNIRALGGLSQPPNLADLDAAANATSSASSEQPRSPAAGD